MELLRKVIATGYKAEPMSPDKSPLVRAVKNKNDVALKFMLENAFPNAVMVSSPEYDEIMPVEIEKFQ